MNKFGEFSEDMACDYIAARGFEIIERNFRTRYGEIDIIASDIANNSTVFIEVKARRGFNFGLPEESLTQKKIMKIIKTAFYYLNSRNHSTENIRFDVITIKKDKNNYVINHIKNAFEHIEGFL